MSQSDTDREDTTTYSVVVNDEEQYSIWPADRENALGWRSVGKTGTKDECLAYIKEVWTDMRPLSLRKQMEEAAKRQSDEPLPSKEPPAPVERKTLIERLSDGDHAVVASLLPKSDAKALKERIDLGHVHIKFTETRGGTELGVRLDPSALDMTQADFENQTGTVHLEGGLTLDYVKVRCVADIDLATLSGTGRLVREPS